MKYRAVLDPSAIRAYADGSIHVGELIGELRDERVPFALPVAALVEVARAGCDGDMLRLLVGTPNAVVLPVDETWERLAAAARLLDGLGRACAAIEVVDDRAGYVVTCEPDVYGGGIETIAV